MGPFEKVNFHICGPGVDLVSKLISGGGKRSSYLSNFVTVNIVTDDAEEDVFDKMKIEEAQEVGVELLILFLLIVSILNRFGGLPACRLTGSPKAVG